MNYEQAYQWLHGDRTEYSGCRAAAEAMEAEIKRLRDALKLAESYIAPRVQHTHGHGETQVIEAALMRAGAQITALAANERRLIDKLLNAQQQRDELRRALEIIAVGDAQNPQAQAAEELIALGWWRDIPEARTIAAAPAVGAA